MALTNYPDGVSSFGVPVMGGMSLPSTTGRYIFVSSVSGSNGNTGLSVDQPVATLRQALLVANANVDDIVVLMANHVETVSAAYAINKAGVRIIGLGVGSARPTFTFGTSASVARFTITGANIGFWNCIFVANFADIGTIILVGTAPEFKVEDCVFRDTTSVLNMLACVTTTITVNSDGMRFNRNRVIMLGTTGATTAIKIIGTMSRLQINDNYFNKAVLNNTACILNHAALVVTNLEMARNTLISRNTDSATGGFLIVTSSTTNTGFVYNNNIIGLDVAGAILISGTGHRYGQNNNLYSGDVDTSGFVLPAIGSDA